VDGQGSRQGRTRGTTGKVRKRLVLQTAQTYEQDVDLVGTVTGHEWAWPKGATEGKLLLDLEGRQVALVFHPELVATVRTILGSDEPLVRFTGTGVFDSNDRLLRVIATHSLDLVESAEPPQDAARSRILSELEGLAQLKPGWLDGEGTAYAPALLDTARALLFALLDRSVPAPCVLPTPEGEVRLEWSPATPYDVSACLDADGAQVYLHSSPGLMDEFDECTLACTATTRPLWPFSKRMACRSRPHREREHTEHPQRRPSDGPRRTALSAGSSPMDSGRRAQDASVYARVGGRWSSVRLAKQPH
jgi:hypothetical protein